MLKLQWFILFGLTLLSLPVCAEEAIVIDNQSIGESAGGSIPEAKPSPQVGEPVAAPNESTADDNEANRIRVLKGGRMSLRQKVAVERATLAESNKQLGDDFLAANMAKPGVVTLPSGVQYKVLRVGKGRHPGENSVVRCLYRVMLIDGTEFDKAYATKPADLSVTGLLPGLKEAIKLMSIGSKWQIFIPSQLAYGEQGNRGIGPNAVLIYDLEIIGTS